MNRDKVLWIIDLHGEPIYGITTADIDRDKTKEILIPTMSGGFYIYHYYEDLLRE